MPSPTLLHITLLPGLVQAFLGGWASIAYSTGPRRHHASGSGPLAPLATRCRRAEGAGGPRQRLQLMPNEYEAFFNKASKQGADVTRGLAPEERAQRAMEGEKLEDDIIEIATVMREKADEMVAETGAINFEVIQPMIDEIAVLKSKYKAVMGASEEND